MYGISDMLVSLVEGSGALWPDLVHKLQAGSAASMATQLRCAAVPNLDDLCCRMQVQACALSSIYRR